MSMKTIQFTASYTNIHHAHRITYRPLLRIKQATVCSKGGIHPIHLPRLPDGWHGDFQRGMKG